MGLQATLKCVTYPNNEFRNSIAESMVWCIEPFYVESRVF